VEEANAALFNTVTALNFWFCWC